MGGFIFGVGLGGGAGESIVRGLGRAALPRVARQQNPRENEGGKLRCPVLAVNFADFLYGSSFSRVSEL